MQLQRNVVVAISQIPIEEVLKPPREKPRRRLYRLACLREDRTNEFLRYVEEIKRKLIAKGINVVSAPIPLILGLTRLSYGFLTSYNYGQRWFTRIIHFFVGRGGRYHSTLKQVMRCVERAKQQLLIGNERIDKLFRELLHQCRSIPHNDNQCVEQCEVLFNVLGDVLIISSAIHLARKHKDADVFLVTNNVKDICGAIVRLRQEQPISEIQRVRCGTLKDLESFAGSSRRT